MDRNLVYTKTPAGEEATLQRTRVVQRNLRMVLLQVDGQLNVAGLVDKIGNESLVLNALRELEKGGFITLSLDAPSVWEQSKKKIKAIKKVTGAQASQFSVFGTSKELPAGDSVADISNFSTFGKPLLEPSLPATPAVAPPPVVRVSAGPGLGERLRTWLNRLRPESARDLAPFRATSWPKRIAMALLVLLVLGMLGILLFPYSSYRPALESALAEAIGVPVRIGSVDVRFFPRPVLALSDVRIGQNEEVRISAVSIPRLLALSGSGRKEIGSVELSGVTMNADFAGSLWRMQEGIRNSQRFGLESIDIKGLTLNAGDFSLPDLSGKISFTAGDSVGKFRLQSADGALKLELTPSADGAALNIEGTTWKSAENSPYQFNSLSAKGLLQPGKAVFPTIELSVMDGLVQGSLLVDWSKGFSLAGDASLTKLSVRKLSKTMGAALEMDGQLAGNLRLRAAGNSWQSIWEGVEANLGFQIERGLMNGVDLGEATRRGVGASVRGGATKFERLSGNLQITAKQVNGSNLEMDSGLLKATGQFVARRDKTVDGNMQVSIQSSVASFRAPVKISGMLPTLQVVVTR